MIATVNKNDLVALGFSEGTSKRIIRQGKELLIARGFIKISVSELFLLLSLLNYLVLTFL